MTVKLISMVCNCLSKVVCVCASIWTVPSNHRNNIISQRDLREWKRIEHIGEYTQKRH